MKKLIFIFAVSAILTTASGIPLVYYVSLNGKIECKSISLGINKARVTFTSGKRVLIPLSEINSYSIDGRVYDKLLLFQNNKSTKRLVFMEKISDRDGFSLYRYATRLETGEDAEFYFVYKENQYNRSITSKNHKYLLPYFGVKVEKLFVEN